MNNKHYRTNKGIMIHGKAEDVLNGNSLKRYKGKIQLIFTSPPFPLNRKKKYGNYTGNAYIDWLTQFSNIFHEYLKPDGSIVIELGNAWERGKPVMSTLAIRSLLSLQSAGNFYLCQEFVCYNPARLPSPAQWVNVERIRVKDSFTKLWWLSPTDRPKADNRRVLKEYSESMKHLLKKGKYNNGMRPSEHNIGKTSFLKNNQGSIPPNVLIISNTNSSDIYYKHCKKEGIKPHPARMPEKLASFFISFLTEPGDIVMDPFAGSNTTGIAAERLNRKWLSIESDESYIQGSACRFRESKLVLNL